METEILEVDGYKITKPAYKLVDSFHKKYDILVSDILKAAQWAHGWLQLKSKEKREYISSEDVEAGFEDIKLALEAGYPLL